MDQYCYITCMVFIKKANFLPHQSSEQVVPEPKVQSGERQGEHSSTNSHRKRAEKKLSVIKSADGVIHVSDFFFMSSQSPQHAPQ